MPGVLVLEALAQASAILAYRSTGFDPTQKVTYLMAIDGAKFRKPRAATRWSCKSPGIGWSSRGRWCASRARS